MPGNDHGVLDPVQEKIRRAFEAVRDARLVGFELQRAGDAANQFTRLLLRFQHDEEGWAREIEVYAGPADRTLEAAHPTELPMVNSPAVHWGWTVLENRLFATVTCYYPAAELPTRAPFYLFQQLAAQVVVIETRIDGE
jgi:hypothetical protein